MTLWLDGLAAAGVLLCGLAAGSLLTACSVGGLAWRWRRRALRAEVLLAAERAALTQLMRDPAGDGPRTGRPADALDLLLEEYERRGEAA